MQHQVESNPGQPASNLRRLFPYRSLCYKFGLVGLFASFALFLLGFSTSHWIVYEINHSEEKSWGLWNVDCHFNMCNTELLITRIIFAVYCGSYLVSLCVGCNENRKLVDPNTYHSRKLEIATVITGALGIASLNVFSFFYGQSVAISFGWSKTVTALSLAGLFVSFFILLFSNMKPVQGAGMVLSLNQPQQQTLIQQVAQPPPPLPNPMYAPQQSRYPVANVYSAPQYPLPSQPLMPQQPQPYPYPAVPEAPPPYSMPPAYPSQQMRTEPEYPAPAYPSSSDGEFSKASAPPME